MDEYEIECNESGWLGWSSDLESKTEALDDTKFIYCPDCGSDDIQDFDEDF